MSCQPLIERFAAAAIAFARRTRHGGCLSLLTLFTLLKLLWRRSLLRLRLNGHLPGRLGIARWTLWYEHGWSL